MEENETTELKASLDEEKIIQTMVAFGNQKGGRIYIGTSDDGKILGVNLGKQKLELFTRKVHDEVQPTLNFDTKVEEIEGKTILIISVQEAKRKPVFYRGVAYKRINKTTLRIADPEEIRNLFTHKTIFFDEIICENATLDDLDERTIDQFIKRAQGAGRIGKISDKPEDVLKKLCLMEGKHLKNGAVMLFGSDPRKFFQIWGIRCAIFSGSNEFLAMEDNEGNLFEAIEKTMDFIQVNLKKEIKIVGLRRTENLVLPREVMREALVNAVAHRDYFFPSYIYVAIHPEYIEIRNPGKLEGLRLEELSIVHPSVIKNPHLAQALYLAGYIERWGSGTLKMIDGMREHSLSDPKFLVDQMFSVRLSWEKQRLNEREKFILENLKADQKTTPTTLAKRFNISLTTAVKDFTRLVKLGMVKKEGTGRGSSYALTKSY